YHWAVLGFTSLIWLGILYYLIVGPSDYLPYRFIIAALVFFVPLLQILTLYNSGENSPLETIGRIILGLVYCFVPFLLFCFFSIPTKDGYDPSLPLGILFLNFGLDTGAYFAGKSFGKHPLFARVSPNKTWEGYMGGILLCLITSYVFQICLPVPPFNWMVIAVIICMFSPLGDLVESLLKRHMNLKDSGNILPGHGGMLDRFDGLYMAVPFLYFYLTCC
ncbi:MAG: phosphatidate cytidylyltransferase, partial [Bacteroidota bacterium]